MTTNNMAASIAEILRGLTKNGKCAIAFKFKSNIDIYSKVKQRCIKSPWCQIYSKRSYQKNLAKPLMLFCVMPTVQAFSFQGQKKEDTEKTNSSKKDPKKKNIQTIIEEADRMYDSFELLKLYDYLVQYKDINNDEILWRLARAAVDKGKLSHDEKIKKDCTYEAFDYIKRAMEINDKHYAIHKWYATLLNYTGEYEGTTQLITNAFLVKEHFMKAVVLNPKDATSMYALGHWCYVIAEMAWYKRKIAATLYATPPTSSFEEALTYFRKAENVDPDFYSMNHLMLGKTYIQLKEYEKAALYLKKAAINKGKMPDDQLARTEAQTLLKSSHLKPFV